MTIRMSDRDYIKQAFLRIQEIVDVNDEEYAKEVADWLELAVGVADQYDLFGTEGLFRN